MSWAMARTAKIHHRRLSAVSEDVPVDAPVARRPRVMEVVVMLVCPVPDVAVLAQFAAPVREASRIPDYPCQQHLPLGGEVHPAHAYASSAALHRSGSARPGAL